MLEALRDASKGWIAKIFLGLLVLSFAVWGIADVFTGFSGSTLATVGGVKIAPDEFSRIYNRELQSFSRKLGQNITMERAREIGLDRVILDDLLRGVALESQARSLGLEVSAETIRDEAMANPAFKNASGGFDATRFRNFLDTNGQNEESYVASEKVQRLRSAISEAVAGDPPVSAAMVAAAYKHQNEQRDAKYFVAKVAESEVPPPGDADIKKYYEDYPASFTAPEYRSIAILRAEAAGISARLPVTGEEVKAAYDNAKSDYAIGERRSILQIVFATKDAAQKAKDRIAKGEDFLAIAGEMEITEQIASLGTVAKSELKDRQLANAAFEQKDGAVSDPVASGDKFLLIKTKVVDAGRQLTFEEAAPDIRSKLQGEKASEEMRAIYDMVEDARAQQTPFESIAEKANLPFALADAVDAAGLGKDGKAVEFPHKDEILKVAFETDPGVETDAISTQDGGFIWFAVREVTPAAVKPFDEVKDKAKAALAAVRLRDFAIGKGAKLAERGNTGAKLDDLAKEAGAEVKTVQGLKRNKSSGDFDAAAVNALFSVPEGKFASAVEADGMGARVMQPQAVLLQEFSATSAEAKALAKSLADDAGADLLAQYLASLEGHVGVNVDEAMWRQITGVPAN